MGLSWRDYVALQQLHDQRELRHVITFQGLTTAPARFDHLLDFLSGSITCDFSTEVINRVAHKICGQESKADKIECTFLCNTFLRRIVV